MCPSSFEKVEGIFIWFEFIHQTNRLKCLKGKSCKAILKYNIAIGGCVPLNVLCEEIQQRVIWCDVNVDAGNSLCERLWFIFM